MEEFFKENYISERFEVISLIDNPNSKRINIH